ncbi:SPFH domain-containing protein [Trinickia dinghuensis]|uniref:Protease modulator HflK n=1 Tax=Trinickia dinghuensis TaxID=2291023 RepID=A0A3D8JYF0_9BURK|nr:SPFH domain-containing protein [Trinickia dinghuensis]RDU97654.1 protease modulator HflK [Trinickia dinghuensis]
MSRDASSSLGPGGQAVRVSFWFVVAVAVVAAGAWAFSNVRRIPADGRAVVMRFGAFVRKQDAGLLIAWPRPFETVVMVPGSAHVLSLPIRSLQRDARASAADAGASGAAAGTGAAQPADEAPPEGAQMPEALLPDALAGSGYMLTGDDGVVQLNATLYYRVVDPYAYVLQKDRLDAALERIVSASALQVAAARDIDSILVARPEQRVSEQRMALERDQLRTDVAHEIERHLDALEREHAGLGVEVVRVDLQAAFPAAAVGAFTAVLTSLQQAERNVAEARTFAEQHRQEGQQHADTILANAQASAVERVAQARSSTAAIAQLEQAAQAGSDPGLMARLYRDRMQQILSKVHVTTVDPHDTSNLILPGNAR